MPLHPHLHLLIPSADRAVLLEARIYLPAGAGAGGGALAELLTTTARSTPTALDELPHAARDALRALFVDKIVTGAHPWGRFGGNMLFPVISHHIPLALYGIPGAEASAASAVAPNTVYATFNVRGVGLSGGNMPWPGWGIGSDGLDFGSVESAVVDLVGSHRGDISVEVYRIGYSYGTNLALNAPITHPIKRTLLISPAPKLFKAMTLFSGPTFAMGLTAALDRGARSGGGGSEGTSGDASGSGSESPLQSQNGRDSGASNSSGTGKSSIWLIFGTADTLTGVGALRALGGNRRGELTVIEVEGCSHFYTRDEDVVALCRTIGEWIN